jgi:hypothetical protein
MSSSKLDSSESSWLSPEGKPMDEKLLLELWKQYTVREANYLDLHFKYANWYSALFIALFTAYAVGFSQYYKNSASILFLALPLLVVVLAYYGQKAVDRFYLSFLEAVTSLAKLEKLLGFDGAIWVRSSPNSNAVLWPGDKYFIPSRHYQSRYDPSVKTSEEFIDKYMNLGASKTTHNTFLIFQITAALLLLGGIVLFTLVHLFHYV